MPIVLTIDGFQAEIDYDERLDVLCGSVAVDSGLTALCFHGESLAELRASFRRVREGLEAERGPIQPAA